MSTVKPTSIPSKRLATSINAASTTLQLNNILGWDGNALTSASFGSVLYAVLRNSNNTQMELMELDPTTIANSAITINKRGLSFTGDLTTETTANKLTWIKNDTIVELGSDSPQLFQWLKEYIDAASIAGAVNATSSVKGIVEIATQAEIDAGTATGATGASIATTPDQLALSIYATRLPSAAEKANLSILTSMSGMVTPYAGRSAPSGWLLCDGTAYSRSTYSTLFSIICPSQTFTVTSASPGVFTATAHGLVVGDKIHLTTTGGLYSGLATNTDYYVISSGLTADAFQVSLTPAGAAVNTSGSQSGVHTMYKSSWGKGDGSTTFNIPDLRARAPIGLASSAPTSVLTFQDSQVNTGTDVVTILDTVFPSQGQTVVLSTTGTLPGGLSPGTYYVIRASSTTIKFASSQANANAASAIDITSAAGGGIHTMTFTHRTHTVLGRNGGEETHGISVAELASHTHANTYTAASGSGGGANGFASNGAGGAGTGGQTAYLQNAAAGSDSLHNIMSPFSVINYIIKT